MDLAQSKKRFQLSGEKHQGTWGLEVKHVGKIGPRERKLNERGRKRVREAELFNHTPKKTKKKNKEGGGKNWDAGMRLDGWDAQGHARRKTHPATSSQGRLSATLQLKQKPKKKTKKKNQKPKKTPNPPKMKEETALFFLIRPV